MAYKPNDHYARKAREEHFAARSVYKLEEIDHRFKLFRKGMQVLDLGCSPGSWAQYASAKIGPQGRIFGIDLKPVTVKVLNAYFMTADIRSLNESDFQKSGIMLPFDSVISDMAPNTTGNKLTDQARSYELCMLAFETAQKYLKPQGDFVCKIFESEEVKSFRDMLKDHFREVHLLRPKSTQSSSKELFVIAKCFLG